MSGEQATKEIALSELLEMGRFPELKECIEEKGVCVDSADVNGDTALHVAASKLQINAVKYLLLQGADPNAANHHGSTPLHKLAASSLLRKRELDERALEIAMLLVECDGDPCLPNAAGLTPYALCPPFTPVREVFSEKCARRELTVDPRHLGAVIGKGGKTVERLQKEYGCTIDARDPSKQKPEGGAKGAKKEEEEGEGALATITLIGGEENVAKAAAEVERLVAQVRAREERAEERRRAEEQRRAEDDTATTIKVPSEKIGFLIGAKGKNITAIRKEFGVEVVIADDVDDGAAAAPGGSRSRRTKDTAEAGITPVYIKGKNENVYAATDKIMGLLKEAAAHRPQQRRQRQQGQQSQQRAVKVVPRFHVTSADPAYAANEERGGRGERRERAEKEAVAPEEGKVERKISMDEFPSIEQEQEQEEAAAPVVEEGEKKEKEEEKGEPKKIHIIRKKSN